ncbi:MAG TPA: DEDD exonuclease domain-containing protein [Acidimicrobiia bacterium]|nr:DEDD exonuclease domain-containing protein [Acidimicrobiia bacterium]
MALPDLVFQPSFDDLSTPLFDVTFCVLDLETTGGSPASCEITEIGAVKYRGGDLEATFQTLVDPGLDIPPSITILTGITQAMVIDAPKIESVLPSLLEFIGDAVIVGHNVRFDLSFLNAASMRLGYGRLPNKSADTAALARRLVRSEVRNLRLRSLAAHFRSPTTPNHRALEDARATAHVFHALLERAGSLGVTNLDDLLQLPTARGSAHYSKIRLTENLPRRPGVYVFKDRNGAPIYIGKATNLRARVRQYFYGDTRKSIAGIMRELDSIEYHVCDTVLEAEITELRMIHADRPRHNRRSRPPKSSHFVKVTDETYPRLSVVRTLKDDGIAYLGPFRSKKAADEVVAAIWDAIPIRRCHARAGSRTGKCAPAQLGVSQCPCDGSLDPGVYALIVGQLLAALRGSPGPLLGRLEERMARLARQQRYEEAGWARDRHDALVAALRRRWEWQALADAGWLEVEHADGTTAVIDHGTLVETRPPGEPQRLRNGLPEPVQVPEVAPSVEASDEVSIIWRWLETNQVRLSESTGALAYPLHRPERLTVVRRAAA